MQSSQFNLTDITDLQVELRTFSHGHSPPGCLNSWVLQPFPIFVWNINGYGQTQYRDSKLETVKRPENSVAYILANETRRSITESKSGLDFVVAGFVFEYHSGADFLSNFLVVNPLPEKSQDIIRNCLNELLSSKLKAELITEKIQKNITQPENNAKQLVINRKCGYTILDALLEIATPKNDASNFEWQRLNPALIHLNKHYRDKFDIDPLLQLTALSRVHFYRLFHRRFATSPQNYMFSLRIREATELLLKSNLTIAEIGRKVGWDDPFYFSRIFNSIVGLSPANYRKNPGKIM